MMKQEQLWLCHKLTQTCLASTTAKRTICSPFPPRPTPTTNALATGLASSYTRRCNIPVEQGFFHHNLLWRRLARLTTL
jgi:hypothetical protein